MSLRVVPVELSQANEFVARLHRHHKPAVGHRFSIGCEDGTGKLRGVCIVGRPVARNTDQRRIVEVTRLCTDGARNACSLLYAAAARAAEAIGYEAIQTFILDTESGTSLRAAGWSDDGLSGGGSWASGGTTARGLLFDVRRHDQPECAKRRYVRRFRQSSSVPK